MNWMDVPLWSLYRRVDRSGRPDLPLLSVYRDHGVVLREGREDNYNKPGADLSRYKIVRRGDLVINKMKTWQGSLGVSAFDGIVSPAYFVAERIGHVDDRFMHHLLRSQPLIAEYGARSKGIRPAQWDLPWDEFASIKVRLPHSGTQRAIADYLDTETGRTDTLITKKRRMIELLEERRAGTVEAQIRELATRHGESPLKFHTPRILVGIVITPAAYYADSGIPALRGINIKPGYLDLDDLVYLSEDAHVLHSKSRLFHGDIVVVRTGQAGAACVVPPDLEGSNCVDLLIVRNSSELDPRYLEYVINADWTIRHIEKHSVGTIQSHFNVESLKQLPIPVPPLDVQQETAAALDHATGQIDCLLQDLQSQIKLLTERRQALITAAVTGELAVPGAAA